MDLWALNSVAWILAACAFLGFIWWVLNLRNNVRYYLAPIDLAAKQMSQYHTKENPIETAERWKKMSNEELVREIEDIRQLNHWAKDIASCLEGLKASVPFLNCPRR